MSTVKHLKWRLKLLNRRRIIVENISEEAESVLYTSEPIKTATPKKHKHRSNSAEVKHKLRQINYEKAIRAYIGYLACNVSENSTFGRGKLIQFYKEKKPVPVTYISGKLSTVDTSRVVLKENKMTYDEYRRQNGPMTKFSEYMAYYRS